MSVWPWSDLITYVTRYGLVSSNTKPVRVLELGCGAGEIFHFYQKKNYYILEWMVVKILLKNSKKDFR